MTSIASLSGVGGDTWQERLATIVATMREMSLQTDPQEMVKAYSTRMRTFLRTDGMMSLSRRGLERLRYRITRSSRWSEAINPWKQPNRLPVLESGLLGELIYGDEPRIINDLRFDANDPAAEYFEGFRSLIAIPNFDQGTSLNMVVLLRSDPNGFDPEQLPEWVWMSNLFGRATQNLVLSDELKRAYAIVDREMHVVADIQRSLLPASLPQIPGVELAAHYETSSRAGGDYYDFFQLCDGRWGMLIADVSGHGTPAAVIMAITHSIAHTYPGPASPPSNVLNFVNQHLTSRYTGNSANFVTALYGIYNPATRELVYGCAGHNPPRVRRRNGHIEGLDGADNLPLGIELSEVYVDRRFVLEPGDEIVFYTDGITEAASPGSELFGVGRLDALIRPETETPAALVTRILAEIRTFTHALPAADDRTLVVARFR